MKLARDGVMAPDGSAAAGSTLSRTRPHPAIPHPAIARPLIARLVGAAIARVAPPRADGGYVPEVDALRAIAMSLVVVFHCGLLPFGWMGVWLFFVVSGFAVTSSVMGGPHPRAESLSPPGATAGAAWRRIGDFYRRRVLRIWPVYFAFLAANVVALLALGRPGPLEDLPWLASFTQNIKMILTDYTADNRWVSFGHLWTLSVEQQFYLVFPLLLLVPGRRARALILVALIAAAPAIRAAVAAWAVAQGWNDDGRVAFAVYAFGPAHFDAFAAGALIALFRVEIARDPRLVRAALGLALTVAVLHVGVFLALGLARFGLSVAAARDILSGIVYGQGREITVYLVPTTLGAAAVMGILAGRRPRLFGSPALQAVGRVSYGGYLYHAPVLMLLGLAVPVFAVPLRGPLSAAAHAGLFICGWIVTVAVSWLSFVYFEQPVARAGARWSRRRRGRIGAAGASLNG